jgi:tetratricopeptide (TPR) repeat protein
MQALLDAVQELSELVDAAYEKEKQHNVKRGHVPSSFLSIKELDLKSGKDAHRPSTTRFEVYEAWKGLVACLTQDTAGDLLEYTDSLLSAVPDVRKIDPANYRHLKALVNLLQHTVENRQRDNSTECRYVTLLEIMLSYGGSQWKPSERVSKFWVRLMQRLPSDVAPVNFRRKAYRVLVSLSWVPSSKGLLGACSFEENPQNMTPAGASEGAKAVLAKIRNNAPLPRYDCVNQLLDRLKDETDVVVAITSESEGVGKTTLAALVALHPSILRVFTVLWLSVEHVEVMPYETYIKHLDNLCGQLGIEPIWPECIKRFEEPALRRLREELLMRQAREHMSELLLQKDQNMLLIMDDVIDARHIVWFRFNERQSIIVTTEDSDLEGVDWTVRLDPMSVEESIELFLIEANFPAAHILGSTLEVRSIVQRCGCHPLTIRTVARWYQLKQVTAGLVDGMKELEEALENCSSGEQNTDSSDDEDDEYSTLLFDILSLMMGPTKLEGSTSILFVICLSAMTVVFPESAPLDAVLLLWEQILRSEPYAIEELGGKVPQSHDFLPKQAWFIAEGMTQMGVISVLDQGETKSPWVTIHHKRYREFGMFMAREMDLADTFEETVEAWNKAFVAVYFDQRIQGDTNKVDDNSWEYAIEKLPKHMIYGRMLKMSQTILGEENFFKARVAALGWNRAINVHIEDCIRLQHALEDDNYGSFHNFSGMTAAFEKTAEMVKTQAEGALGITGPNFTIEVSTALYKIGFALADNGYVEEAIIQLENAQNMLPQSQVLRASILYGLSWAHLVNNESEKAMTKITACRKIMDNIGGQHMFYRDAILLYGDVLTAQFEYEGAATFIKQTTERWKGDSPSFKIEFGMLLHKKGLLHLIMGETEIAKTTLIECINWKIEITECSNNLATTYSFLGDINMELRHLPEARDYFTNGISILDTLKYDPGGVNHLLLTGKLRFLQHEFKDSFETLGFARAAINCHPVYLLDKSAYDLRVIARAFQAREDTANAIAVLNDSLDLTGGRKTSLERASGLLEIGNCLLDEGQVSKGLIFLEQSLKIRTMKLGECMQVLQVMQIIGGVHFSTGAYDESLKVFEEARELTERVASDDVERIAGVLYSIGEAHDGKGDISQAVLKFKLCVKVLKNDRSSDHPDIAKALQRLGHATVKQKDLDGARAYYSEALRIRRLNFNEQLVAETLHSLGVLSRKREEYGAALELFDDADEIWKQCSNMPEYGRTLLEIGNTYRVQNQPADATSIYKKGLEVLGENDEVRGSFCLALGHLALSSDADEEALQCYKDAHQIRLACYGKDDMYTGNASRSLGIVKYLLNKGGESMAHLNEFVRVCELKGGSNNNSRDYVLAVMLLGDIYKTRGRLDQAKNVWSVAREVCDDNKHIGSEVPAMEAMIDRRLFGTDQAHTSKRTALLGRLEEFGRLGEEAAPAEDLLPESQDVEIFRQIMFMDD